MSLLPAAGAGIEYVNVDQVPSEYVLESAACFLCNIEFQHNEDSWLLFETRSQETGELDSSIASVLSSALGKSLAENEVHSKFLCATCNAVAAEYEAIEQRFYQLKYKIVSSYNKTANSHGLETVLFEGFDDQIEETPVAEPIEPAEAYSYVDFEEDIPAMVLEGEEKPVLGHPETYDQTEDMKEAEIAEEHFFEEQETEVDEDNIEILTDDAAYEQIIEQSTASSQDDGSFVSGADDNAGGVELQESDLLSRKYSESYMKRKRGIDKMKRNERQKTFHFDGVKYECLLCLPLVGPICHETDVAVFAVHMSSFHSIPVYTCELCQRGFGKRNELSEHFDQAHMGADETAFPCDACDKSFVGYRQLRVHKRSHYHPKQFECAECQRRYPSKKLLEEHMNMHTGQRPFACPECPKSFASKYTLNAHLKIHTERPRPFQCSLCSKAFLSTQNLNQHMKLHSGVKEFACTVCGKAFNTQHNMEVHMIVHTGKKPFMCRTCGKGFARRAEVQDHERIHTGERPFKCETCDMSFAQRSNLTSHIRSKHLNDRRYVCAICDRSFKRKRLLDYHTQAAHTGERPYKCDICASTFVYPEHHKKHMRIHSGDKPYLCEVCGKPFSSRDNRNAHRFTHSDKKPYECLVCGMGFMRKPQLYNHMQQSNHINDTIIVNQPRISKSVDTGDGDGDGESAGEEVELDMEAVEEDFVVEEDGQDDEEIQSTFVKEEYDNEDVRYIQFSHKDDDGKDLLTWVDFGEERTD